MRLRELKIKDFRRIRDLTVSFSPGLSVIIGENNVGKTGIIDALRLLLFSGRDVDALRVNEDDLRQGPNNAPIEVSCSFCDLTLTEEAKFLECLVKSGSGKFEARLNVRVEFDKITSRPKYKTWGGETEKGNSLLPIADLISCVYLKPLRDPDSGLRAGANSQIARLIRHLTPEAKQKDFIEIVNMANTRIKDLDSVKLAKKEIDDQMEGIAGNEMKQETELVFSDPTFAKIVSGILPEIEGLPFSLNGLGYNNLIYAATTLGTLQKHSQFPFKCVLIEEPEAHLHPQLQVLLLNYLNAVASNKDGNDVQIIVSSHSPILASQAPIDSIVQLFEKKGEGIKSISISKLPFEPAKKDKLKRFLDATRAELFFARRILMVEGIAEAFVIPILAKRAGGDIKEAAVTIINTHGINFDAFLPLFAVGGIIIPIAILTDGDAPAIGAEISDSCKNLKAQEALMPNLRVRNSVRTFEHELARHPKILACMLDAMKAIHPGIGQQISDEIGGKGSDDDKANYFYEKVFKDRDTSKGEFAQELAAKLEKAAITADDVPGYIREAFDFLEIIDG